MENKPSIQFLSIIKIRTRAPKKTLFFDRRLVQFELSNTNLLNTEEGATEFLQCIWPFFRMYRLFGMCPVTKDGNRLLLRRKNPYFLLTAIAVLVQAGMLGTAILGLLDGYQVVDGCNACIYYGHTLCNSLYMTWAIKRVPNFITACQRIEILTKKYCDKDDGLVKSCTILFVIFVLMQFIGNVMYYYSIVDKHNVTSFVEFEVAFNREFIGDGGHISAMALCIGEFYSDCGWTFTDLILCLLSLILAKYFTRINSVIRNAGRLGAEDLENLRLEHQKVCGLVEECNNLFSPLFLCNYAANVGYLFTRLFVGLNIDLLDPNLSVKLESMFAFWFQVSFKLLLPSYLAAKLHEKAKECIEMIHRWPSLSTGDAEFQNRLLTINRFVLQAMTSQVGISGCGYFILTKSFVITLLSALVTYEIIILQFQASSDKTLPVISQGGCQLI